MEKIIFVREKGSKLPPNRIYEAVDDEKLNPDYLAAKICLTYSSSAKDFYSYEIMKEYLNIEIVKEYRKLDRVTLKPVLKAYAGIADESREFLSEKAIELIFFCRKDEQGKLLGSLQVHYAVKKLFVKDKECFVNFMEKVEAARKKATADEEKLMKLPQDGHEAVAKNIIIAKEKLVEFQKSQLLDDYLEARNMFIFAASMDFRYKTIPGEYLFVYKTVTRIFENVEF